MMQTKQNTEDRIAERRRLEACARWHERQSHLAKKNGDYRGAQRHDENADRCRLRQR